MPDPANNSRPNRRSQRVRSRSATRLVTAIIVLLFITGGIYFGQRSFGRGSRPAAETAAASTTPTGEIARVGGAITEGDIGLPTSFNPLLANSQTERDLSQLMFAGLTRVDGSGTPQPGLASKWEISPDGLTYTISLRAGLTWQDGAPFTSQDVRFTIGLVQSPDFPGNADLSRFWRPIVVETPDDNTVIFHLMDPFSPFLNYLNLPILPKHILGGVLAQDLATDPFGSKPVGTGPFKFDSYDKDHQEIKLTAFAGYFGDKPTLSSITIQYFDSSDKLLAALKSGAVQATGTLSTDQLLRPGAIPSQDSVYAPLLMSYTALFFNTRVEPFSSQTVRQALQLAINPAELTNGPLKSQAVAGSGPIPETSWAFSAQTVAFDQQKASAMLEKAGWKYVEKDDVLENGDVRLAFQLLVNGDDPQRILMAQTIAQQLSAIHVRVDVLPATSEAVGQALTNRQFSAAVFGGHYANGDPDCLDVWHSSESNVGLNFTGINDQSIDKALQDARSTTEIDKRKQLYAQFQKDFVTEVPAVVLYYPRYLFVVSSKVHGVKPDPIVDPSDRFQQIASWYFGGAPSSNATP